MIKIFRDVYIHGNKTNYLVSNKGNVKSLYRNKLLTQCTDKYGYKYVGIRYNNKTYQGLIHRLVAIAFIPNPEHKEQVNHIDGNKTNNSVINLEWATPQENMIHCYNTGLHDNRAISDKHGMNKYTIKQIKEICNLLQENKLSINEIAKKTNVGHTTVNDIRNKKYWTHISKDYSFDNYNVTEVRRVTDAMKKEMYPLIQQGFRKCDILRHFNLDVTKANYAYIKASYNNIKKEIEKSNKSK